MRLESFQSEIVLKILQSGQVYKAKPSISFKREYAALIDMLKLNCVCPVFAVVRGRKQNTSGRISDAIRLELDVPDEAIKFTEFSVWADFMYGMKFAKNSGYKKISVTSFSEVTQKDHDNAIRELKLQRPLKEYNFPQAILEEIRPEWLVSYRKMPKSKGMINFFEKIANAFRK